jgi:hypothetical protein
MRVVIREGPPVETRCDTSHCRPRCQSHSPTILPHCRHLRPLPLNRHHHWNQLQQQKSAQRVSQRAAAGAGFVDRRPRACRSASLVCAAETSDQCLRELELIDRAPRWLLSLSDYLAARPSVPCSSAASAFDQHLSRLRCKEKRYVSDSG